ncbi:unnamed protein product [Effrenium voratum]|nr:unnamed protein product [Effrenium voratum]
MPVQVFAARFSTSRKGMIGSLFPATTRHGTLFLVCPKDLEQSSALLPFGFSPLPAAFGKRQVTSMASRVLKLGLALTSCCFVNLSAPRGLRDVSPARRCARKTRKMKSVLMPKEQQQSGLRSGSQHRRSGPGQFDGGDSEAMAEEALAEAERTGLKLDKKFPTLTMRWTNKDVIQYMRHHPGPWGAVEFQTYSGSSNTPFLLASKQVHFGGGRLVSWNFIKPTDPKEVVLKGFVRKLRHFMLVCGVGFKKV